MRSALASIAGLLAMNAGCQADNFRLDPVPVDGSIQSVVVVLVQGTKVRATAFAPQQTNALRVFVDDLDLFENITVWAVGYHAPLDELGIKSGPQAVGAACLPNPPQRIWQGHWSDEMWPGWTESSALPEMIGGDQVRFCSASASCTEFEAPQLVLLPTTSSVDILEPLPDGRFLIADQSQQFFVLQEDGTVQEREDLDGLPSVSSMRDASGQLWLGGRQGRVATGTIEAGFVALDIPDLQGRIVAISVSPNQQRVLALSTYPDRNLAAFLRTDGQWRLLGQRPVLDFAWNRTNIIWTSDENAVFVHGGESFFEVRDRFLSEPDLQFEHPDSLVMHPEIGLVLGAKFSPLQLRVADSWRSLPASNLRRSVYALLARPGGIYVGGNLGVFWDYDFANPAGCLPQAVASSDVEFLKANEAGTLVLAGSYIGDEEAPVTILRRTR